MRIDESGMTYKWRLDGGQVEVKWGMEGGWMADNENVRQVEVGQWLAEE